VRRGGLASAAMEWPPQVGELLPRADEAVGVRKKLEDYSLAIEHKDGGPKAHGFAVMLGITLESVDYLEAEIRKGILCSPITKVADRPVIGVKCVVEFPLRGLGDRAARQARLRTVWEFADRSAPPRLVSAFLKH
jgi:hypothetical protein